MVCGPGACSARVGGVQRDPGDKQDSGVSLPLPQQKVEMSEYETQGGHPLRQRCLSLGLCCGLACLRGFTLSG